MVHPIMEWSSNDVFNEPCIWWWKVDERYQVEVRRITKRNGELVIFDHRNYDSCVYSRLLNFDFDSELQRPDVSAIAQWEDISNDAIARVKESS